MYISIRFQMDISIVSAKSLSQEYSGPFLSWTDVYPRETVQDYCNICGGWRGKKPNNDNRISYT